MRLTRPVTQDEAHRYRAVSSWADEVPVDVGTLAEAGERVAIVDRGGAVTYAELAAAVERVAGELHRRNVGPGEAVVIVTDNERESVVACYATWRLGAVAILVHRSSGARDVELACWASSPVVVLLAPAAEQLGAAAPGGRWSIHTMSELAGRHGAPAPSVAVDPDTPRLVLFTSGTTAKPKGVVHTANTLRASTANYVAMTELSPDERFFLVSPLASMAGVLQVLALAPALGAAAVLENAWDEARTLDLLVATRGTFYGGTDHVLARLFDVARRRGVRIPLRAVAVGGTMLRPEVLHEAEEVRGINVVRVYGSSEAPSSTGSHPSEARDVRLGDDGRPMPGVELRVADGGSGELLVRGPHVFRGYLDPRDNDDAFDREWFRTGDAAELRNGRLRVVGRLKELANRNGRKVSLAEVEDAFRVASGIELCAAFSINDDVTGERVALALQLPDERPLDVPKMLDTMVSAGLAKWKLPESVLRYRTPFPMTATGKVQRRALSEDDGDPIWRAERLEQAGE